MRVVISGFGAMGKVLLETIAQIDDIELIGVVDPLSSFGHKRFSELQVTPDIIIDFSHPDNLTSLLQYATSNNVGLVIATTGITDAQNNLIEEAAKSIPVLYTGNTSLGINVLNEVVKSLTKVLQDFDIEIIEKHHNQKVDAPSGTAKMFLKSIEEERDVTPLYGRNGVSKRKSEEVTVHAVRGGTISGEHSIIFAGDDEIIEVKHTALSKKVFAKGAITAARYVKTQKRGLFTMKDIF